MSEREPVDLSDTPMLYSAREYHMHKGGDVVQGSAARCIDPDAGAVDVRVIPVSDLPGRMNIEMPTTEQMRAYLSQASGRRAVTSTEHCPVCGAVFIHAADCPSSED